MRQSHKLLNEAEDIAAFCRHLQGSDQTYHRWRYQYGGMKSCDVQQLKDLEKRKRRLKHAHRP